MRSACEPNPENGKSYNPSPPELPAKMALAKGPASCLETTASRPTVSPAIVANEVTVVVLSPLSTADVQYPPPLNGCGASGEPKSCITPARSEATLSAT